MRGHFFSAVLLACLPAAAPAGEAAGNPLADSTAWDDLRGDILGDAAAAGGETLLALEAPYRAQDAAAVPVILKQKDTAQTITSATVVIDENPAPVAGTFTFSEAMAPLDFAMNVRVNQYSNVRVIADTGDGLFMTGRFVKASGGCSAPATKDPAAALAGMGQMQVENLGPAAMSTPRREARITIRHPNYSGLQRDQVTHLFIGAHFIDSLEVYQGDSLLFTMEGGISISENPAFRFAYTDNGAGTFTIRASDTEGNVFEQTLPVDPQS